MPESLRLRLEALRKENPQETRSARHQAREGQEGKRAHSVVRIHPNQARHHLFHKKILEVSRRNGYTRMIRNEDAFRCLRTWKLKCGPAPEF